MRVAGPIGGRRAQSIQIGALLLFAILIINLSLFQTFVVPDQNEEIEFKHSQQVQEEMKGVRNAVFQTSVTGTDLTTSVQLAPQYPSRTVFVNPAPPAGSLRTESLGGISFTNIDPANEETKQFWDSSTPTPTTNQLVYQPGYNLYTAPDTVYENSVVFNTGDNAPDRTLTGQSVVNGRRISLVTLTGNVGTTSTGAESLEFKGVSASTDPVPVSGGSGPLQVTIPTTLSESEWEELLDDQLDGDNTGVGVTTDGDEQFLTDIDYDDTTSPPTVTLTFEEDVQYDLRLARVGVGSGVSSPSAAYITDVQSPANVGDDGTVEYVVEVRDELNNPVSGVDVTATESGDDVGSFTGTTTKTTGGEGRVSFVFDAGTVDATGTEDLEFSIGDVDGSGSVEDYEVVEQSLTAQPAAGAGTGSGSGSGSASGSSNYGTGGTSSYANDSATATVSVENGRYTGIYSTDELILSSGIPTVDTSDTKERLEYETTLDNGTTTYTVQLRLVKGLSADDWNKRRVAIFDADGNSQSATLTKEAAAAVNGSGQAYEGTDLLDVNDVAYDGPGSSFEQFAAEVRAMDDDGDTTVTALTATIEGRVDATIRQEALFSAAQPQPSDGSQYQFVRVNFETPTNTTGWVIRYEESSGETTLPTRSNVGDLSGDIYFAADESAFETERGLADDMVYPLDTSLQNADNLTLVDSVGDRRDELAFEPDADGSPDTTNGWTVSDLGSGEVAVRKTVGDSYRDADRASDWRVSTQTSFFGASGPSVAFVPNSNQQLIRTVSTSGTVVDYGTDSDGVGILGPKADLDDDGQDEVAYIGGSNGQSLRYMEVDGSSTTLVGSKVKQTSAIGVGDPDGDGMKTVYYAVSNGDKLKRVEVGGSAERVSLGTGNSPVDAKGAVGYADVNDDGDDNIIYLPVGASNEIAYVDGGSTTTVKIGPPGNRRSIGNGNAVGSPVVLDSDGSPGTELRVPIVDGNQNLLLVDPGTGSFETVNQGSVQPKKTPVAVRDWRGDATKEVLVVNGNDNSHLYWVEANTAIIGGTTETGEARGEQVKTKGVR